VPTIFTDLCAGLNTQLHALSAQLTTDDGSNALPVVNLNLHQVLNQIPQDANLVASFQTPLTKTLTDPQVTLSNLVQKLTSNLGALLVGQVGLTSTGPAADPTGVTISLHLASQNATSTHTNFGLGLPSIPLLITSPNDTAVQVGFDYSNFVFGIDASTHQFFLKPAAAGLTVSVDATLPNTTTSAITGAIGFLPITATDGPTATKFHGDLTMDVNVDALGNASLGQAKLTGLADVHLQLASVVVPGVPQLTTAFDMNWAFDHSDTKGPLTTFGGSASPPTAQFSSIKVDVGDLLGQFAAPQLKKLHDLLQPLQPTFNALTQPLPVIGSAASALNQIDPTLGSLLTLATDVNQLTQDVPGVVNALNGVMADFGTFDLSGNGDLRNTMLNPPVDDANATSHLTTLAASAVGKFVDFSTLEGEIVGKVPAAAGVLGFFDPNSQPQGIQLSLTFPVLSDPLTGVSDFLLGKADDLIRFDAEVHDQRHFSGLGVAGLGLPVGIVADFNGDLNLDGSLVLAYDTTGLLEAVTQMAANPKGGFPVDPLKDGLYMASGSHLHIDGDINGTVAGLGPFASAIITGGANVHVHLDGVDSADAIPDGKRRLLQPSDNKPGECLFMTSGGISGELSGVVFTTVVTPIGPITIPSDFDTGLQTILDLSGGCIGNPLSPPDNLMLANTPASAKQDPDNVLGEFVVTDPNGVLTLNLGPNAGNRNFDPANPDGDFTVTADQHREGDPAGEAVLVGAFGFVQRYAGVKEIDATCGDGGDTIYVGPGILAPANLQGGAGDDNLKYLGDGKAVLHGGAGNDVLFADGSDNQLYGGTGNDQLTGGKGTNHLYSGTGNSVLKGGSGPSFLYGQGGDDKLFAGSGDAVLDGGAGNVVMVAGKGTDQMIGGAGQNTFEWTAGDGNATVNGGGNSKDVLVAYGSSGPDTFRLTRSGQDVLVQAPGAMLDVTAVARLDVEPGQGADSVTVNDLVGTRVNEVDVNLLQAATPDQGQNVTVVNGSPQADQFQIKATKVAVEQGNNPTGGGTALPGGVTDVQRAGLLVRVALSALDNLSVDGLQGGDQFDIQSSTGPTTLTGAGADTVNVHVSKPADYLGPLTVDGKGGPDTLRIDESASPVGDHVVLTSSRVVGDLLPNGVSYQATGGFGGGVTLVTTPAADTVNVRSTLAGAVTSVDTGGGDDVLNLSSDAPVNTGDLAGFRGHLVLDAGDGNNVLNVSDLAGTTGNQQVVLTGQDIQGLAGPAGGTDVAYAATGGSFGLIRVDGPSAAGLPEQFLVAGPAGPLDLRTHGGPDQVVVTALGGPSSIDTGYGNDEVTVQVAATSAYDLTVNGTPPADGLRVLDVSGGAVVHDHAQGGGSGEVDVFYLQGATSRITYQGIAPVVADPDADRSFVQALYHTVDRRDGSPAELDAGVAALHGGTTRAQLADHFERSTAARTLLISGWYKAYFNLQPTPAQLAPFLNYIATHTEEQTLSRLFQKRVPQPHTPAKKMAVVKAIYKALLGRLPSVKESKAGVKALTTSGVAKFVLFLVNGSEYRARVVKPYFSTILRRTQPPLAQEVNAVIATGDDLTAIRVKMEASPEFYANGH
jgi:Ca2+-binding RTX toxin-like protein